MPVRGIGGKNVNVCLLWSQTGVNIMICEFIYPRHAELLNIQVTIVSKHITNIEEKYRFHQVLDSIALICAACLSEI